MQAATKILVTAVVLGLAAMVIGYRSVTKEAEAASLAVSFPFFGIAVLAFILSVKQRTQPDAHVVNSRVEDLVKLLVFAGCWVFVVLFVWGL